MFATPVPFKDLRPACSTSNLCVALVFGVSLVCLPSPLAAQTTEAASTVSPHAVTISNALRDAANQFDAGRIPDADSAKRNLVQASQELVEFLQAKTSPRNAEAWLDYLKLDPLLDAIESDQSATTIGREAVALHQRLYGTAAGLELSRVRALREAVAELIPAVRFRDKEKSKNLISRQLNLIADKFEKMESVPSVDEMSTANLTLDLLQDTNQITHASDVLRSTFQHPNIAVWIDGNIVQTVASRPVNESSRVNDCILGTSLTGTATMTGSVSASLIPAQGAIGLNVSLTGRVISRNRGYNKPVVLQTTGYGDIFASRNMYVSESGFRLDQPCVNATLQTEINSIEHRLRIVRRIARKKAAEQKSQADRIGLQKLRERVSDGFVEQTDAVANMPIPDVISKVQPVLRRLDIPVPTRSIGSTHQAVYLQSTVQRSDQLAAPVPAPPIQRGYDAAIQIHESLINNTIGYLLAGRTISKAQMDQMAADFGKPTAQTANKEQAQGDFEVDFAKSRPIIFEARDGKIRLGIRGTRFAQGSRELKRALEITASYSPATTPDGAVILVRDGEVDIDFPGKRKLSITQAGMKAPIKKNFAKVFPDSLMHQPIAVPQSVKVAALRGRLYRPRSVAAEDGWFTILLQ